MQRTGVAVAEDDGKGERCRPARSFETPPHPTLPLPAPQDEREEAFSQTSPARRPVGA